MSKGTHVIIPLVDYLEDERWEAKVVEQSGNKIKLSVNSPATAVCGLYGLTVTTGSSKGEATSAHACSKNVVMLFNPWCEGGFGRTGCGRDRGRVLQRNEERSRVRDDSRIEQKKRGEKKKNCIASDMWNDPPRA